MRVRVRGTWDFRPHFGRRSRLNREGGPGSAGNINVKLELERRHWQTKLDDLKGANALYSPIIYYYTKDLGHAMLLLYELVSEEMCMCTYMYARRYTVLVYLVSTACLEEWSEGSAAHSNCVRRVDGTDG